VQTKTAMGLNYPLAIRVRAPEHGVDTVASP
jgi:hypothetical protein